MTDLEREEKLLKKFEKIDPTWKNTVESQTVEELKATLIEISKNEELNQREKDADEALEEAKEAAKAAGLGYSEASKINHLKIKFALRQLDTRE